MSRNKKYRGQTIAVFLLLVLVLLGMTLVQGARIVQPGYVGVQVRLGASQDEPLDEGLHFVMPYLTQVHPIDTRIQRSEARGEAASKDLQTVAGTLVVNYHLEKSQVVQLYRQIGVDYEAVVIGPSVQEVFKAACSELQWPKHPRQTFCRLRR